MKSLMVLLVVVVIVGATSAMVLAQEEPPQLPPTAGEAVAELAAALAVLAGLLANRLTEALGRLPFLSDEDKNKLRQPLLDIFAAVFSVASGYILASAAMAAGFLDESGWWQVILWSWPTAYGWFRGKRLLKGFQAKLAG